MAISVRTAAATEVAELAAVAAATFPLACPPTADPADIAATVAANLSPGCFTGYLADPDRVVLVAVDDDRIVGYTMLIRGRGDDPDVAASVPDEPAVELSKMYVVPDHHRTNAGTALMECGMTWAAERGATVVWLGVNQGNQRAQRFYAKHGFLVTGARAFRLGSCYEADFVMVRAL